MKKSVLTLALLLALAAPSFAYVQSGQLVGTQSDRSGASTDRNDRSRHWMDSSPMPRPGGDAVPEPSFDPLGEPITRPIPEPGTMILASLGLLALGVSRARRRGH